MIYRTTDMYSLLERAKEKTLICFGAGKLLKRACEDFLDISFFDKIDLIADNDKEKHIFEFTGVEKSVYSIELCLKYAKKEPVILITMTDCLQLKEQLGSITELRDCECFHYLLVQTATENYLKPYQLQINRYLKEPVRIPKTIHYCWFGGAVIPDNLAAYMNTWKKYCPDYEIVRWDESNYDYKQNKYMYEAYEREKWGFVSDFARLDIIYQYGGVYFDTDVELIRNIDGLLCDDAFCGFESLGYVNNGSGFGATAGFPLVGEMMRIYDKTRFINTDGSLNLTPCPKYQTELLQSKGLILDNTLQNICGMTIYPSDVLAPLKFKDRTLALTDNTYAIHHYAATWFDMEQRECYNRSTQKHELLKEGFEMLL